MSAEEQFTSPKCAFCGEDRLVVLEKHHVIPRQLHIVEGMNFEPKEFKRTIVVCANCHQVLTWLLQPIMNYIQWSLTPYTPPPVPDVSCNPAHLQLVIDNIAVMERFGPVKDDDLYNTLELAGVPRADAMKCVSNLMREGTIFSPRPATFRRAS